MISLCLTLAGFSAAAVQATPAPQADPPPVTVLPDVEVAARRGAARTPPQYEYDAARIDALAGGSVGDVLGQTARQFSPGQPPVVIINGVRMPDPSVFLDLPPDALERLEVLPAGSAAEYGGSPSGRVFNLVLQRSFASRDGALTAAAPTAGGFRELSATARQSGLQDRNITNLTLTLRDVSALLADDRQAYLRDHPDSAGVSLTPESRFLSANAAFNRSLGDWAASLNASASQTSSRSTARDADGLTVLSTDTRRWEVRSGLSGPVLDWTAQVNLLATADVVEAEGPTPSQTDLMSWSGAVALNRSLPGLGAGPIAVNLSADANRNRTRTEAGGEADRRATTASAWQGQITVPLSQPAPPPGLEDEAKTLKIGGVSLGGLSVSLGAGGRDTDAGGGNSLDLGAAWQPRDQISLSASWNRTLTAPSDLDRFAPPRQGPNAVVYDFRTGEAVEVQTLVGGNPDLTVARSEGAALNLSLGPFTPWSVGFNQGLSLARARDGISSTLQPTPQTEAAYPDRFLRDASGRLVRIDLRPFNATASETRSLTTSLSLNPPVDPEASAATWTVNLFHTWRLTDRTELGRGLPVLDRLAGDGGGVSGQDLGWTLSRMKGPLKIDVTGRWTAGYRSRATIGEDGPADLRISDFARLDLKATYRLFRDVSGRRAEGARLELSIQNLTDERPSARLADGAPAPGYGRDSRDPVGRRIEITLGKRF